MLFTSKYKEHVIVIKPARHLFNPTGERQYLAGVSARFHENIFETNDPEIIAALKAHRMYGIEFSGEEEKTITPNPEGVASMKEERQASEDLTNSCPHCAYKANTASGLRLHIKAKHNDA